MNCLWESILLKQLAAVFDQAQLEREVYVSRYAKPIVTSTSSSRAKGWLTVLDARISYSARMRNPPILTCSRQHNSSGCPGIRLELGSSSFSEVSSARLSLRQSIARPWPRQRSLPGQLDALPPYLSLSGPLAVSADLDPFNRAGLTFRLPESLYIGSTSDMNFVYSWFVIQDSNLATFKGPFKGSNPGSLKVKVPEHLEQNERQYPMLNNNSSS